MNRVQQVVDKKVVNFLTTIFSTSFYEDTGRNMGQEYNIENRYIKGF